MTSIRGPFDKRFIGHLLCDITEVVTRREGKNGTGASGELTQKDCYPEVEKVVE